MAPPKRTVIRRFGDKAGLLAALLGEHERGLQEQIVRGRPPLGPGASPLVWIDAFLEALTLLYVRELPLVYASETASPGARYRTGAYRAWRQHLALLVREARPDLDGDLSRTCCSRRSPRSRSRRSRGPRLLVPQLQACARGMLESGDQRR